MPTSPTTVATIEDEGSTIEETLDLRSVKYNNEPTVPDIPKQVEISIGGTIPNSKTKHVRARHTKP